MDPQQTTPCVHGAAPVPVPAPRRRPSAMALGMFCLFLAVLFMLAGALPAKGGGQTAVFRTPLFVFLLSCLCASLLGCSRRRLRLRGVPFLLVHLGVVLILAGAFLGFLLGRRTQFGAPIAAEHAIRELPGPEETTIELPFALSVSSFNVEFYPPVYHLYHPPAQTAGDDEDTAATQYAYDRDVHIDRNGMLHIDADTAIPAEELTDARQNWTRQYVLPDGRLLQLAEPTPKHFEAILKMDTDSEGMTVRKLAVNHPVSFRGWRFYLMSYDREAQHYVVLSARRDPGRKAVITGIWAVIVGIAWLCWRTPAADVPRTAPAATEPDTKGLHGNT